MTAPSDPWPCNLTGKSAVVTGSSSGIGRAIALEFGKAGAQVLLHTRQNAAGAREVLQELESWGRAGQIVSGDLSDPAEQTKLVEAAWNWRPIDIWVNNAGADVLTGTAASWTFEQKLQQLWAVDVLATVQISRAVGQRMQQRGQGVILNMGWDQAELGMEGDAGQMFGTTKAAVAAFSRSLAKSLAPEVRVNCLAPGWIRTRWGDSADAYWQARAVRESLLGRWGEPADVAHVALFLASSAGTFVNGQVVPINGGLRIHREPPREW